MNFAFLSGCGHTGTTILCRMIGYHSRVYNPPFETNTFLAYNHYKTRILLDEFKEHAEKHGKSLVLEKTPRHIWHIDYIRRVVPGARFILATRNGRDVIASLFKRTGDLTASITRYKDDSLLTLRQLDCKDVILVKYEDLVKHRETELRRICKFLDLGWEERILSYHEKPISWNFVDTIEKGTGIGGIEHNKLRNWQANQPFFDGTDSWRDRIPRHLWKELDVFFETLGNQILSDLGYQI